MHFTDVLGRAVPACEEKAYGASSYLESQVAQNNERLSYKLANNLLNFAHNYRPLAFHEAWRMKDASPRGPKDLINIRIP